MVARAVFWLRQWESKFKVIKWFRSYRSFFRALLVFPVLWVVGLLMKLMLQDRYEGTYFLMVLKLYVYFLPACVLATVVLDIWLSRIPKDNDDT